MPPQDLALFYNAARALVYPSWYEGFGLPVLEAMACQTPVLCSKIPALEEVALDTALYFDPGSIEEMASVMLQLIGDDKLESSLAIKGLQRSRLFSWHENARQTMNLYERLREL